MAGRGRESRLGKARERLLGYHPHRELTAHSVAQLAAIEVERELDRLRNRAERSDSPLRLTRHDRKIYSQYGEDGLLAEIFDRIGTTNKFFVEFGVGDGTENNTVYLLTIGWSGLWIEIDPSHIDNIRSIFSEQLAENELRLLEEPVTSANVESLFGRGSVPEEPDLLSIDIDGNDYYVWQSITKYRPRVVVCEYNALFPPTQRWRMKESDSGVPLTSYFGASLRSLAELADSKDYRLVGCSLSGANALFVRGDLATPELFAAPFTAENHYEPPRYYLYREAIGHSPGFGPAALD